jgi:hypothetical protein
MIDHIRDGDQVTVTKLDCLAGPVFDMVDIVRRIRAKGATIVLPGIGTINGDDPTSELPLNASARSRWIFSRPSCKSACSREISVSFGTPMIAPRYDLRDCRQQFSSSHGAAERRRRACHGSCDYVML